MFLRAIALPVLTITIGAAPLVGQVPTPLPLTAADSTRIMERGHTYMGWILAGKTDSLIAAIPKEVVDAMGGAAAFADNIAKLAEHGGRETNAPIEKMTRRGGYPQFWHEANFELFTDEPLVIRLVFDVNGNMSGIGMNPKSQAKWDH